ncbi:MAG: DNA repair protein RecN [Planctomycetaceae bacterium]
MLRELHITGLGVIEDLDLELDRGLNVLTGETGAGKTMIAVGLSLAAGARASAHLVRPGSKAARVQARFDAPPAIEAAPDGWAEDGEVVLARTVGADGKSGARIGGQLATASALATLGARLVELHGQHQTLGLLDAATQTAFLDRFAGEAHQRDVASCAEAARARARARSGLAELEGAARDRERELDLLAYQVREIEAVAPFAGETEALEAEEARLGHVERLLELAGTAEVLVAGEDAASEAAAGAARALGSAAALDPGGQELAQRATALAAELAELGHDVRSYRESLGVDPARLEEVRARIGALKGLHRKYGATDAEVLGFLAQATERLHALEGADERLEELRAEVQRLDAMLEERARVVTEGRRRAAPALSAALTAEVRELGMPVADLDVVLEPLAEPGVGGAERVELRFAPGAGGSALPLAKAASGGELSRVMLACRSVLADLDDVPTLVFDEVDAGIGGEAGLAVGRRLARLAASHQVLVVTHLPQIACFADLHVRVRKHDGTASVDVLDDDERVRELSRMLAGLETSTHAESHARELLAEAARVRADA